MGLGDMISRLGWDGTQFEQGTNRAKQKATELEHAFGKIGKSFQHSFIGLFAAHSVERAISSVLESVEKIQELAQKFHITTTEVQLLQAEAKRTHQTFEDLVDSGKNLESALKAAREHGQSVGFSPETIKQVEQFNRTKEAATATGQSFAAEAATRQFGGMRDLFGPDRSLGERGQGLLNIMTGLQTAATNKMLDMLGFPQMHGSRDVKAAKQESEDAERLRKEREGIRGSEWAAKMFEKINADDAQRKRSIEEQKASAFKSLGFDVKTDELVGIGNFLGQNPNSNVTLEQISQQIAQIITTIEREAQNRLLSPFPLQ